MYLCFAATQNQSHFGGRNGRKGVQNGDLKGVHSQVIGYSKQLLLKTLIGTSKLTPLSQKPATGKALFWAVKMAERGSESGSERGPKGVSKWDPFLGQWVLRTTFAKDFFSYGHSNPPY